MGKYEAPKQTPGRPRLPRLRRPDKAAAPPGAPPDTPAGAPAGEKRSKTRLALTLVGIALITLVAVVVIAISLRPAQVNRPGPTSPTEPPSSTSPSGGTTSPSKTTTLPPTEPTQAPLVRKKDFYTFLLLGTHDDYNTDTIMLASLDLKDAQSPKVDIISIPRDSQIDVSWNIKKINAVYGVNKGGEDGALAACEWIERITGVYPDFYAVVNIKSFTKIVDLVGGVPFYVPYDMYQDKPDKDPSQQYTIDIAKGQHTLNAEDALNVVRYRGTGRSDWGRMDVQKDFLIALLKRVKNQFSVDKIPGMVDIVVKSVKTNMPANNMVWFYLNAVANMSFDDDLTLHTLPNLGPGKYERQDYVFLDGPGIAALVNQTINPYTTDISEDMLDIIMLGTLRD